MEILNERGQVRRNKKKMGVKNSRREGNMLWKIEEKRKKGFKTRRKEITQNRGRPLPVFVVFFE